ncbi:MAG: DPP IV N-terminal domain-containing protein [Isosphaeraceae bacterium]
MSATLTLIAVSLPMLAELPQQVDTLRTVAERSDYKATARHGDVVALCRELAGRYPAATNLELGRSAEGRSLPLLVLADPPVRTPEEAARSGKLVVLAIGNIHGGEVCGKEALPMLAREILETPGHPLLKDLVIAFAPIYNADGNERVSKHNRPGQNGPEEGMGQRGNARGLDLNRDFIKLEAPETRALVRFFNTWKPHLFIDTHTTNGSHHRYIVTYEGPKNPAGDPRIIAFSRNQFLPEVTAAFEKQTGQQAYYYGNFNRDHTRWTTFPAEGRYGTNYAGMRNRLGILSEAYAYAPFKERVLATRDFVHQCLKVAAAHKDEIVKLLGEAERAVVKAGESLSDEDHVAIRSEARVLPNTEPILGYLEREENGKRVRTDTPKEFPAELLHDFAPTETVSRPYAYLLPPAGDVLATLQRHGLEVQELREDVMLDVQVYRIDELGKRPSRGWDPFEMQELHVTPRAESRRVPAGSLLVKTAQPLGHLAVYLLEPRSEDGLAAWRLLPGLKAGSDFPVLRLPESAPMTLASAEPLPETRKKDLPITFDMVRGGRGGAFLQPTVSVIWLDDDHWIQVRSSTPHRVEAVTGRSRPLVDRKALEAALKALPGIPPSIAGAIASGEYLERDPANRGALFQHNDDLYYAAFDGSRAVRLTDHPGQEQYPRFSPDGQSVAFIRGFDLHVVSLADSKERALSTGGTDTLRHGIADWVYYEEIFNRNWPAFWWSPDSKRLALMEFDDAPVGTLTMLNDTASPRKVEENRYPRAGEPNPKVRIGVVDASGGPVRWADLSGEKPEDLLISHVGWWPDSSAAYLYLQNRTQTWLDLCTIAASEAGAKPRKLFRETTRAWVADQDPITFLKDGSFLWLSERDGWKHIYHYDADGKLKDRVTSGEWEVRSLAHVDADSGWITFTGTRDEPISPNLYRTRIGGPIERLTHGPGSHQVAVSPGGKRFVATSSDLDTPARVRLFAADGQFTRTLDSNPAHGLKQYRFGPRERVSVPARDGFVMEGELILPPDLDPEKKYSVWFTTYGGPHTPMTSDGWFGGRLWDQALAAEGFVVFRLDPRSASGKGAVSAWRAYRQLGVQELEDIKDGIAWLKRKSYVDSTRIGMSGHSYGGFMTSYAMTHCDLFAAGIAGAPVTDWRDYDTIYTERFMGLPKENTEGYERSSVVKAARNLHGKLLLIHGAIDDNVSLRNTMRLVEALQAANKDFELMIYPGSRHGVFNPHYARLQIDFIRRTLGSGARPPEIRAGARSGSDEGYRKRSSAHGIH